MNEDEESEAVSCFIVVASLLLFSSFGCLSQQLLPAVERSGEKNLVAKRRRKRERNFTAKQSSAGGRGLVAGAAGRGERAAGARSRR